MWRVAVVVQAAALGLVERADQHFSSSADIVAAAGNIGSDIAVAGY